MRPLQSVGMGLVVVALGARVGGYDVLPDPLGWLLVLHGVRRLSAAYRDRTATSALVGLALAVSAVLWFPATGDWLDRDASLRWAVSLPQALVLAWLAHTLAEHAARPDPAASRWLRTTAVLLLATAVLPVLVIGGGLEEWEASTYVLATLVLLLTIWLAFAYSGRAWAAPDADLAPSPYPS